MDLYLLAVEQVLTQRIHLTHLGNHTQTVMYMFQRDVYIFHYHVSVGKYHNCRQKKVPLLYDKSVGILDGVVRKVE